MLFKSNIRSAYFYAAFCLTIITWGVQRVKGYPTGAPQDACGPMLPYHGPQGDAQLYPSQTGPAPYSIQVASHHGTYLPGKAMNVTLMGNVAFKGFLLQARVTNVNTQVGTWSIPSAISAHARHVACGSHDGAVTHRDNTDKTDLTFSWNAPPVGTGDVKFVATVAQNHSVFWVKMTTDTIEENKEDDHIQSGACRLNAANMPVVIIALLLQRLKHL